MHALFATPAYPPLPGGGERYVHALAHSLIARGIRVTVATSNAALEQDLWRSRAASDQPIQSENEGPVQIFRCSTRGIRGGFSGLRVWRKAMVLISSLPGDQSQLLRYMARRVPNIPNFNELLNSFEDQFDLVHAFNLSWEYPSVAAEEFARSQSIPFVLTPFIHTGVHTNDRVSRNTSMDHQLLMLRRAKAVHTLTDLERNHLLDFDIEPQRIHTMGSGIDPLPAINRDAAQWAAELTDDPFVLFLGRNSFDKGAIHASNAVLRARIDGVKVSLILAGQPTREFDRYYHALNAKNKRAIMAMGVLPEDKKQALLERTQMLLLPSRTDSFGIVILEAWAHSKPVIGARAGGLPEVISDGEDGFLVEFGDEVSLAEKIKTLLKESQLCKSFARAGQQKIQKQYTWEIVSQKVLSNYERILSERPQK